jgi:hypothetical protein
MLEGMLFSTAKKSEALRTVLQVLCYAVLAWLSWLMLEITLNYWPVRDDAGFLQIKQQYLGIKHWEAAFWIHVFTSMLALRVWKYTLVLLFEPRPMDVYRLVAWLGFVPNVLLVEWLIHRKRRKSAQIKI